MTEGTEVEELAQALQHARVVCARTGRLNRERRAILWAELSEPDRQDLRAIAQQLLKHFEVSPRAAAVRAGAEGQAKDRGSFLIVGGVAP